MAISKLDAGKAVFEVQPLALSEIFDPLRDELAPSARSKGLTFDLVHSGLSVISDPGYLRRIVQNLLSNAIRYTDTGRVLGGVRRVGDFARIEVWIQVAVSLSRINTQFFKSSSSLNQTPPMRVLV